ncbi:hypothetical protein [Nocardia sp. NBC_01009]|uniref:hypothetical protein n=1 Tax=Nocardia sp. NBC_01009 TaxID=2975996 RepID=UPI003867D7D7|nr:hypothetical protein OHA42_11865 [Nocardia sp. NBC_01009]
MIATCPSCSWPAPALVSSHGPIRYLRCVCGQWLVSEGGAVVATAGISVFSDSSSAEYSAPVTLPEH